MTRRKLVVANGSKLPVELADTIGILAANELILDEELMALRLLSDWLRQLRVGLGLRQDNPTGLWLAIASGAGIIGMISTAHGGDRALFRLTQLFDHFTAQGQLELLRFLVRIAGNEAHPENAFELARLRYGAQILMHLQRRGRRSPQPAPS